MVTAMTVACFFVWQRFFVTARGLNFNLMMINSFLFIYIYICNGMMECSAKLKPAH